MPERLRAILSERDDWLAWFQSHFDVDQERLAAWLDHAQHTLCKGGQTVIADYYATATARGTKDGTSPDDAVSVRPDADNNIWSRLNGLGDENHDDVLDAENAPMVVGICGEN